VPVPALSEQEYESDSILYLKPAVINKARVDELANKIKANKNRKVVLDLRDVSGGDPDEGLRLANLFINQGTLAALEGQKYPKQTFPADPARYISAAPLAVLVNRGTYGAAELTAAAILGAKRGDVVGERTFGEGSVQKTIDLPDGGALLLTIAKYQGPDGKKIQDEAVVPSVVVGPAQDDDDQDDKGPNKGDEPLNKALQLLKAKTS
jgi:carboxyl-terminal processing protease